MKPPRAFTLVELLVVMGIIAILFGLIVPAVSKVLGGSQLNQVTDLVASQLKYARQTALSENKTVEVRFYKYVDSGAGGSPAATRAMQVWQVRSNGTRSSVGKLERFPGSMIVSSNSSVTNLGPDLDSSTLNASEKPASLPANYQFKAVQFQPDGSTTLDSSKQWFITLKSANDAAEPPRNFATIQIEPVVGSIRIYRP